MRIVSWNVNGLYTTLKDAAARYTSASNYFSEVLKAEIVCIQEAKVQEEKLEKWMACVEGYDSHWAFSQEKKGYSGVVTYVKQQFSPVDAKADWLGERNSSSTEGLCNEGRLICTDHGSFVLLNVYVPNAGDQEEGRPRLDFKMRYLTALEQTCDELVESGKHVVIVGDFNVAHKDIDVHARWKVEDCYSLEERKWLDGFLSKYIDLYRHFHPDEKDVFSVWNQKTEARIHNEGLRIDYAICDKGFSTEVLEVDIVKMVPKAWSDHAAVVVMLKEQPSLPPHPAPALSSRNMKRFNEDPRQKKLTALFSKGPKRQVAAVMADKAPEVKGGGVNPVSELASDSVIESCNSNEDVTAGELDPSVPDEKIPLMQPEESAGTETALAAIIASKEVLSIANTAQEAAEPLESISRSGNNGITANQSKSSQLQTKGKGTGKTLVGKRKHEPDTKGPDCKQRSVSSFFKAANAK